MRVLIIEDETRLAALVADGLARAGIRSEAVHDGIAGLDRASTEAWDAIVLDILLPGMNGFAVCRELRAAGVGTPILMLTAKDGDLDETEALEIGADDYLRKPFSFDVLIARLRALVRRTGRSAEQVLQASGLEIDTVTRQVSRDGAAIDLSTTEFDLLLALARRVGQVVTRQTLYDEVWGYEQDHKSNVIEVFIRYLRQKVDEPFGVKSVQTVRGSGYRLAAELESVG
ncbi:MAG: response regulator transcription factor [Actinomycetota bacterium]